MAAWAGLPLKLVGRILERLHCRAHHAAFSAVCSNWRTVAVHLPPPPQLPWLLLPSAAAEAPAFLCILCGETHPAFLPDDVRTARFCGSRPGGWLVLRLQQQQQQQQGGGLELHNLHSGDRIYVPGDLRTLSCVSEMGTVLGAALSTVPTVPRSVLAVVLAHGASQIAFWLPGTGMPYLSQPVAPLPEERFWRVMLPDAQIEDVVYFVGYGLLGFHVLTSAEEVMVYIPCRGTDGRLSMHLVTYRFPNHQVSAEPGCTVSRYLISFLDRLVMVVRFVSTEEGQGTQRIRVYQLRVAAVQAGNDGERQAYWDEWWFPDNRVVILGRCSSRVFASPGAGAAVARLFFCDDARSFDNLIAALGVVPLFPCTDMGSYSIHPQGNVVAELFERMVPARPPSEFSPPVWFFH